MKTASKPRTRIGSKCCICKTPATHMIGIKALCAQEDCRELLIEELVIKAKADTQKRIKREQREAKNAVKADRKQHKQKTQDFKDKHWGTQFKLTVAEARKLGNLLDLHLNCICCNLPRTSQFCGGHFKTMKARPDIAFDLRNIAGQQNKNCNEGLSGNIGGYKAGLLVRHGQPILDFLEVVQDVKRWTPQSMKKLRTIYAAEIRHIRKGNAPTRDWRDPTYDLLSLVTETPTTQEEPQ